MKHTHLLYGALVAVIIAGSLPVLACGGKHGGKHGGEHKGKMFEMLDTNADGKVTKAEFLAAAEERFSKMDADSDGNFTKEEAKAHHQAMKEKFKSMHKHKPKHEDEAPSE